MLHFKIAGETYQSGFEVHILNFRIILLSHVYCRREKGPRKVKARVITAYFQITQSHTANKQRLYSFLCPLLPWPTEGPCTQGPEMALALQSRVTFPGFKELA